MAIEAKCCICDRILSSIIPYSEYDPDETHNDVGIMLKTGERALCAVCRRGGKTVAAIEPTPVPEEPIAPAPPPPQPRKAAVRDLVAKAARDLRNAMIDRNRKKSR